ncbi:thiamine-triphosphatase isoform X1 [Paroedura picta]|uniref:thiamine-triphosphatase isoform X1 n=1 Tax=Paroedura picta TaxID=143630 RepID=UPI004057C5F8
MTNSRCTCRGAGEGAGGDYSSQAPLRAHVLRRSPQQNPGDQRGKKTTRNNSLLIFFLKKLRRLDIAAPLFSPQSQRALGNVVPASLSAGINMATGFACNAAAAVCGSHAGKDPGGPASGSIEVEQKFLFQPGIEETLVALGATLAGNVSFQDHYFDTPNWHLTLADHWLREREGAGWELKCPPRPPEKAGISSPVTERWNRQGHTQEAAGSCPLQPLGETGRPDPATQYQEVTCPRDIVARVCGLLGVDSAVSWGDNVAQAVEALGLEKFASFVTRRRKYRLRGFNEKTQIPGKISVYLHKFRPAHYERLMQAGRVRRVQDAGTPQGERD